MLTQLSVKNLAIVTELELHFDKGMHVITGETGAGKSILIDALSLALGDRASPEQIRAGQKQAEVTACFDIRQLPAVQQIVEDNHEECIIRRIISTDGRSRAYINGVSVTVQQLKTLAPHLVQIHSQHQHHALLNSDQQRQILDAYSGHENLLKDVQTQYQQWLTTKQELEHLTDMQQQADKLTLLNYQLQELQALDFKADELQKLDMQHKQLSKSEELITTCQDVSKQLTGDDSILDQLHVCIRKVTGLQTIAPQLKSSLELLQQAVIQVQEADSDLDASLAKLELDPKQLDHVEQRLSAIHTLARKLKVAPEQLQQHQQVLNEQYYSLAQASKRVQELQILLDESTEKYNVAAEKLTNSRITFAKQLTKEVIKRLHTLELPKAIFEIKSEPLANLQPTCHGRDAINFLVSTNPGQPLALLKKVASGGEMSRISLAIQVITAQKMAIPTLILDEVDVGISGKTAATVGSLMRELGANAQIVCITHLPQVAAHGNIHFKVVKKQTNQDTTTHISPLKRSERVQELARLLGGINVTPEAMANAENLLESS